MKSSELAFLSILLILHLNGCGSSTESRYEDEKKTNNTPEEKTPENSEIKPAVFNMTPYQSKFDFDIKTEISDESIWYGYDSTSNTEDTQEYIVKPGYRVETNSTDNLDEANNIKSELSFMVKQNIYIIFDPPFYRIRIGDFEKRDAAENQLFRLRQLGFQDSRVVSDSIKVPGVK